jgi:ATP-dependent DNA helicase PIF1
VNENSEMLLSPIQPHDPRGELIRMAALTICDEAPMGNKAVMACMDETCCRVMQQDILFGGKVFVLLGDFRQTCPVIRRGSKAQVIDASIKSWPFWNDLKIYHLTQPYRNAEDPEFARFVDEIGDGAGPDVSLDMLTTVEHIEDVIHFVYPPDILQDSAACLKRSILAPTNCQVDIYNNAILKRVNGEERTYLAADSLKEVNAAGVVSPNSALDYIAKQTPPGLPSHTLTVKVNGIYRLIRNLSIDRGLVKNVRVIVTEVGNRLVTVRLIKIRNGVLHTEDDDILIPRISFTYVLPSGHTLLRRQFPLAPGYATTFNSCQGLNLDAVGVDVTIPVFSHGQLYTALSRIPNRTRAVVRMRPGENTTTNVTYRELLTD